MNALIDGIFIVICLIGAVLVVDVGVDRWRVIVATIERRRRGRRAALERRMRAASQCTRCGAIGAVEFRRRTLELLGELEQSDAGQTVVALATYGRRSRSDAS